MKFAPPRPKLSASTSPVIIIGAGPAGLAVAACLARRGVPLLLLERDRHVGSSWRRHYQQLQLHTDKARSALPDLPFPHGTPRYPTRNQFIAYLEAYTQHFRLEPRFGIDVHDVVKDGDRWRVVTNQGGFLTGHVVLATGHAARARLPTWPGMSEFAGVVLHTSRYQTGLPFRHTRVLVIGAGNSAQDVALDLIAHQAHVSWSVRSATNVIPRDPLGLPVLLVAQALRHLPARWRDTLTHPLRWWLYHDLPRYGLPAPPYGPFVQIERDGRVPVIDTGIARALREHAVRLLGEIHHFTPNGVVLNSGVEHHFDVVILATGYAPARFPSQPPMPGNGLYVCGQQVAATGMLHAISREARRIAADIARQQARASRPRR